MKFIQFMQQYRRRVAVSMALAAVVLYFPTRLLPWEPVQSLVGLCLLACVAMAVALFVNGAAGLAAAVVTIGMVFADVIVILLLKMVLPVGNQETANSIGIGVFVLLMVVFSPPYKAARMVRQHLSPPAEPPVNDESDDADAYVLPEVQPIEEYVLRGKKHHGAWYSQIEEYKQVTRQLSDERSLANTSPFIRKLRYFVGFACMALGVVTLFMVRIPSEEAYLDLLLLKMGIATSVILFGLRALFNGFAKASKHLAIAVAAIALGWLDWKLLEFSLPRSFVGFSVSVVLSVWAVIGLTVWLRRRYKKQLAALIFLYPDGNGWTAADLDLHPLLPIRDYRELTVISCGCPDKRFAVMLMVGSLLLFCKRQKLIFAGLDLSQDSTFCRFYLYGPREETDEDVSGGQHSQTFRSLLTKLLRDEHFSLQDWQVSDDPEWREYQDNLYPDPLVLLHMEAETMAGMLSKVDRTQVESLRFGYTLLFATADTVEQGFKDAEAQGLQPDPVIDNTEMVTKEHFEEQYSYTLNVYKQSGWGAEQLKLAIADILHFAQDHHAELYDWGLDANDND